MPDTCGIPSALLGLEPAKGLDPFGEILFDNL
jgi:hypothetical protein